jgi:hypothetical protein
MNTDGRSFSELLSEALNQFTRLLRNELQLAKAEMSLKASQAGMGIRFLGAGALIAMAALVVLFLALANWFSELGMRDSLGHLLSAVIGFVICGGLAWMGLNRLKPENLSPDRTLEQLRRDAVAVKEHAK